VSDIARIVGLSLGVSLTATLLAACVGLSIAAMLAVFRFPGRFALVVMANAMLGIPPVVIGLALYLLLSRAGPLGWLGILFTPAAMVAAQFTLALPIVVALGHRAIAEIWGRYGDDFLALGLRRWQILPHLLRIGRRQVLTVVLAGFGRTLSEVGAILIVGGNIAGHTRTMTTAITLETGEGHFTVALTLGGVLIAISLAVSAGAFALSHRKTP
jgi:tungstate transport system permease protein